MIELALTGKATGRMWLGMDSCAVYRPNRRSKDAILATVTKACGVTVDELSSEYRGKVQVRARQLAAYFLRICTDMSVVRIGWTLGGRDHSTICFAIERVKLNPHLFEPHLSQVSEALGIVAPLPPTNERTLNIYTGDTCPLTVDLRP